MQTLIFLLALGFGFGTAAKAAEGGLSDGGGMTAPNDACAGLAGTTFVSLNEYEGGLGPDGPVLQHWRIRFDASSYQYDLSDFSLTRGYTCSGQEGFVTNDDPSWKISGYYQKDSGLLLWDERWFKAVR